MKKLFTLCCAAMIVAVTVDAQVNLSYGLVADYPFDGTFNDTSGNGHDGTPYGGTSFTTDQWGNANYAAYFDGFDDYVAVAPSTQLTPDSGLTLSFLFKTDDSITGQVFVSKSYWATGPDDFQYQLGFNYPQLLGGDGVFLSTAHNANCIMTQFFAEHYTFSSTHIGSQNWYSVIAVFDHGVKSIYVDGLLTGQDTVSGFANNVMIDNCSGGEMRFGAWWLGGPEFYHGALDEAKVYNRALNVAEVVALSKLTKQGPATGVAGVSGKKEGLVLYPSPATASLNIQFTGTYNSLVVYNGVGQQVLTAPVTGNAMLINTEALPNGNYHLRLSGKDGSMTASFIK
jgi:hypothetical protein